MVGRAIHDIVQRIRDILLTGCDIRVLSGLCLGNGDYWLCLGGGGGGVTAAGSTVEKGATFLKKKKIDSSKQNLIFCPKQIFKLWSQIEGNSVNNCDLFCSS